MDLETIVGIAEAVAIVGGGGFSLRSLLSRIAKLDVKVTETSNAMRDSVKHVGKLEGKMQQLRDDLRHALTRLGELDELRRRVAALERRNRAKEERTAP